MKFVETLTIDAETTLHNTGDNAIGRNPSDPFSEKNWPVYWGYKINDGDSRVVERQLPFDSYLSDAFDRLWIGHNIKYDIHYLWRQDPDTRKLMRQKDTRIWDTQLAEYLLTGQRAQWATLDSLAEKYGGVLKNNKIKEYWKAGVSTENIPPEEIIPYLHGDVNNTYLVFTKQVEKAVDMNILNLIMSQMDALMATTEMTYNGMYFDRERAETLQINIAQDLIIEEAHLNSSMEAWGVPEPNCLSNQQVSAVLFGGDIKWEEKEPLLDKDGNAIFWKTGKKAGEQRFKTVEKRKTLQRQVTPKSEWRNKTGYSVSDAVINTLLQPAYGPLSISASVFLRKLQNVRGMKKDLSTYFEGYSKLVWPDNIIHHKLNHCSTATGRLSSSDPNLQNVTSTEE